MKQRSDGILADLSKLSNTTHGSSGEQLSERAAMMTDCIRSREPEEWERDTPGSLEFERGVFECSAVCDFWRQLQSGAPDRLVRRENLESSVRADFVEVSVILLPGTVYSVALEEVALAMLTGIRTVLLPSRRLETQVKELVTWVREHFPTLAGEVYTTAAHTRGGFLRSPVVGHLRVYGADDTVEHVSALASAGTRIQAYGDMISVAVVDLDCDEWLSVIDAEAGRLTRDIWTWAGLGCFSPVQIFVIGRSERLNAFCEALSERLARCTDSRPGAKIGGMELERAAALAIMQGATVYRGRMTLVQRAAVQPPRAVMTGSVEVLHCETLDSVFAVVEGSGRRYSTVGLSERLDLTIHPLGRSRFQQCCHRLVRTGEMQRPKFERAHDGQPRLRVLLKELI